MGIAISENFRLKDSAFMGDEQTYFLSMKDEMGEWHFIPVRLTQSTLKELVNLILPETVYP